MRDTCGFYYKNSYSYFFIANNKVPINSINQYDKKICKEVVGDGCLNLKLVAYKLIMVLLVNTIFPIQ